MELWVIGRNGYTVDTVVLRPSYHNRAAVALRCRQLRGDWYAGPYDVDTLVRPAHRQYIGVN